MRHGRERVAFTTTKVSAGDKITPMIIALYTTAAEINAFPAKPDPPVFVLWPPEGGISKLHELQRFVYKTSKKLFRKDGFLEFRIMDATDDFTTYDIEFLA
ncbi:MAG TPA: hypothetical protein VM871_02110 [Flavisolibacter sp.]|nr:hypothetical protein [Flavisolibacter sp.]